MKKITATKEFPKPVILVSRCLEFENVRYDGQVIHSQIIKDLMPFVDFIKVCPEYEIGLGVPRDPLRIIKQEGEYRLVQPNTGEDLTEKMNDFSTSFLDKLGDVDGFIFKSRSPSVGVRDIKVYAAARLAPVTERNIGLFAMEVVARYPGYPVEEEDRLRNSHIRHHFLTQLYTFTDLRNVKKKMSLEELQDFHDRNHFLFMSYNRSLFNEMSELFGSDRDTATLFEDYVTLLKQLMKKPGTMDLKIDTFREVFSTFGDIDPEEVVSFEATLERYENNLVREDAVIEVLRMLALRAFAKESYENTFLYPYPEELKPLADEKREKDYWNK